LAYQALDAGGSAPATLNAANELAVAAFLDGRLPFLGIPEVIAATLERLPAQSLTTLDEVFAADALARQVAGEELAKRLH
jgi:1-deoxy-D-xylulose-5-phosphate reductoisomerase